MSYKRNWRQIADFFRKWFCILTGRPLLTCTDQAGSRRYKRNWREIERLLGKYSQRLTRRAISNCTDEEDLRRHKAGWPECFYPDDHKYKDWEIFIALSAIMEAAKNYSGSIRRDTGLNHWDRHFTLSLAFEECPHLKLPVVASWNENDIPCEVAKQLQNKKAKPSRMIITYDGKRCMVLDIAWRCPELTPKIGELMTEVPILSRLVLVEARFVDLQH